MKIKLLKSTIVGGKGYAAGKTVEASSQQAKYLINTGKAVKEAPKAKAKAKAPVNRQVTTDEIETK